MFLKELYEIIREELSVISFCKANGLIKETPNCTKCGKLMQLVKDNSVLNKYIYMCRSRAANNKHKYKEYITKDSFFESSRLPLSQLVELIYFWSYESSVKQVVLYTGISNKAIIQWFQYFRDVCSWKLLSDPIVFGGQGCRVQIDESKFMKLKHNRGEPRGNTATGWVFGIFDETTRNVHFEFVRDRKQETLFPIIKKFVAPGTMIWSDEFASYTGGPNRNPNQPTPLALLGPYMHQYVNHKEHFIDPITGAHTNGIEGSWALCKRRFKYMFGTPNTFLPSYLDEFIFRRRFGSDCSIFNLLIQTIFEYQQHR